jgi:dienelactone hydrolase
MASDVNEPVSFEVTIQVDRRTQLKGDLVVPVNARRLVVFAHGSGSSRFSERNRYVAGLLNDAGLATLLFDLLTEEEEPIDRYSRALRFDIPLLASRLTATVDWAAGHATTRGMTLGLFGASTGAAAALITAAARPDRVQAVVSRGGRPDLATTALPRVQAPTLFIVGGHDQQVLTLNRQATQQLHTTHHLAIVPQATHLFEEPGALEQVATLARDWFDRHLPRLEASDAG